MAISPGQQALASDFVATSAGAPSAGQVPKLNSSGKLDSSFLSNVKFGGDGSDGALSISSGVTTIDCANAAVVIKNYASISITGTGKLSFINPNNNGTIVIIKSKGDVALTSSQAPMIDLSGMGALGGTSVTVGSSGNSNGNAGTTGVCFGIIPVTNAGPGGSNTGGGGSAAAPVAYASAINSILIAKYPKAFVGAGGGSGGASAGSGASATSGYGGRGGGSLIIECAGALNFTTSSGISVAGLSGVDGTYGGGHVVGGGGGGAGGYCLILYNTLTSASGTVNVSGGSGGSNNSNYSGSSGTYGGGGGGGGNYQGGGGGGAGNSLQTAGGGGAAGLSLITKNTEFA